MNSSHRPASSLSKHPLLMVVRCESHLSVRFSRSFRRRKGADKPFFSGSWRRSRLVGAVCFAAAAADSAVRSLVLLPSALQCRGVASDQVEWSGRFVPSGPLDAEWPMAPHRTERNAAPCCRRLAVLSPVHSQRIPPCRAVKSSWTSETDRQLDSHCGCANALLSGRQRSTVDERSERYIRSACSHSSRSTAGVTSAIRQQQHSDTHTAHATATAPHSTGVLTRTLDSGLLAHRQTHSFPLAQPASPTHRTSVNAHTLELTPFGERRDSDTTLSLSDAPT